MAFWYGQKVITITDQWSSLRDPTVHTWPQMGQIYTVRGIQVQPYGSGLLLMEILNPPRDFVEGRVEPSFNAAYFRPLVDTKSDITVFEQYLLPAKPQKVAVP